MSGKQERKACEWVCPFPENNLVLRISKLDERRWLLEAFFGDELVGRCLSLTTDTTVRIGHNLDEAALSDKTPKYECPHGRSVCRTIPDALRGSSTITVTSGVRGDRPIRVTYKTRRPERLFLATFQMGRKQRSVASAGLPLEPHPDNPAYSAYFRARNHPLLYALPRAVTSIVKNIGPFFWPLIAAYLFSLIPNLSFSLPTFDMPEVSVPDVPLPNLPSIPRWLAALFRPLMIIGGIVAGIVASVVAYRRLIIDRAVSQEVHSYWRQRFLSGLSKVLQRRTNQPMNE